MVEIPANGKAFEVEFSDRDGRTFASLGLRPEQFMVLHINLGFSEAELQRYYALITKRRAEKLTPDELQGQVAFSDEIETANARRVENLIALATLQSTSVENLMRDLGITMF